MNERMKLALDKIAGLLKRKEFLDRHKAKTDAALEVAVQELVTIVTSQSNPAWVSEEVNTHSNTCVIEGCWCKKKYARSHFGV